MEVFDPFRDSQHYVEDLAKLGCFDSSDVVEEVSVRAEFSHDHDGNGRRGFRDRDADELDNVFVSQVAEETEFLDVHVGEVTSDIADRDRTTTISSLVDVLHHVDREK